MERVFSLGKRWSRVLDNVYEDLKAGLIAKSDALMSDEDRLVALREAIQAYVDSTKDRTDFVKGVYCGWLQKKSDHELRRAFLNPALIDAVEERD